MKHKYGAKSTTCIHGHRHRSKREAVRCVELHVLQSAGAIIGLSVEPVLQFKIDGRPVKMLNGQTAKFTGDFSYVENGRKVVEDVKGMMMQDVRLRHALVRHLWPEIELRVVK